MQVGLSQNIDGLKHLNHTLSQWIAHRHQRCLVRCQECCSPEHEHGRHIEALAKGWSLRLPLDAIYLDSALLYVDELVQVKSH